MYEEIPTVHILVIYNEYLDMQDLHLLFSLTKNLLHKEAEDHSYIVRSLHSQEFKNPLVIYTKELIEKLGIKAFNTLISTPREVQEELVNLIQKQGFESFVNSLIFNNDLVNNENGNKIIFRHNLMDLLRDMFNENGIANFEQVLDNIFANNLPKIGCIDYQNADHLLIANIAYQTNQSFVIRAKIVKENLEEVVVEEFIGNENNLNTIVINVDENGYSTEIEMVDTQYLIGSTIFDNPHPDLKVYQDDYQTLETYSEQYMNFNILFASALFIMMDYWK